MKNYLIVFLSFFVINCAYAQDLTVHLTGIKSPGEGRLVFLLYANEDGFPKEHEKAYRKALIADFASSASYTFTALPKGTYAVVVMQDKNENKRLDKNFMGIPKEPVGVSNMEGFGKPSFDKSAFELTNEGKTIEVRFMNE